jgi:hypothetical protein
MCAVCFSVAQLGPAAAVAWRARYAMRLRRGVLSEAEAIVADAAADDSPTLSEPARPEDSSYVSGSTA